MSEGNSPIPGDLGVGSHVAGYRLEEEIGRGGMAVVYRAYDARLDRQVALKLLAPELARDEAFRQRFIRESRAAAAVDHPNIIPIFEAGEAAGVLFIAMRYVTGRDLQTMIDTEGQLPASRVCAIITQAASALDAAHGRGLVHRDVKPANILRDARSGSDQPDHVYLSDFGLSKHSLQSTGLTSKGQFLGTLNYVAPEQIEGRQIDGRTDQYALACSAFHMLSGAPPFRRDESLAIMYAQLSSEPPALTSSRPDLPSAVDQVMRRALAKTITDRYSTCLEFAAALRRACGLESDPGLHRGPTPVRQPTEAVRPADLAAAAASAGGGQAGPPAATGWDAGRSGGPPTQAARVHERGPTTPGLTGPGPGYPGGPGAPGYPGYPGGGQPGRASHRSRTVIIVACVAVLAAAGGGYALLGRGGGGTHHGTTTTLSLPACTTAVAHAKPLPKVRTHFTPVAGKPFDVALTRNGFGFVSMGQAGLAVMNTRKFAPSLIQTIPVANAQGETITRNQKYLLVTSSTGLTVFRVSDLVRGLSSPLGTLSVPGAKHPVEVAASPDGRFAFVSIQGSDLVAVFNVAKALTAGFGPADLLGSIPMAGGKDPVGVTVSPDGKDVYVASGLANTATDSAGGTLTIIDAHKAEAHPGPSSIMQTVQAGCGPDRVLLSPDGQDLWVTSGGGNALLAFSVSKLLSKDTKHALIAKVAVGEIPLGVAYASGGKRLVVADSNRDQVTSAVSGLSVIDVSKALAGQPALLGTVKAGQTPRHLTLSADGKTLLVASTSSQAVESVDAGALP